METARDVSTEYINMEVGSLPTHKFEKYAVGDDDYTTLPDISATKTGFLYMVKVYVDDLMSLDIPVSQCSQEQLRHVATAVMMGIHGVFPTGLFFILAGAVCVVWEFVLVQTYHA